MLEEDLPEHNTPYVDDVPNTQYEYELAEGGKKFHLRIMAADLTHYFHRHGDAQAHSQNCLKGIPKKKKGPLPNKDKVEGYGIYAVSGWSLWRFLCLLALSQIIGLGFAVWWLVKVDHKDLQNALAPALYVCALLTLGFGSGVYLDGANRNKHVS